MHGTYERVGRELGFDWENRPSPGQLEQAAEMLHRDWVAVMKRHDYWVLARRERKAMGRRQLSKAERAELSELGWHHG